MRNHNSNFIRSVRRVFPSKGLATVIGIVTVCYACAAQGSQSIQLDGKDSSWRPVGSIEPMTGFQIDAKGTVDFGGLFQSDTANAGVTGSAFAKWAKEVFSGGVEAAVQWLESAAVSDDQGGDQGGDQTSSQVSPLSEGIPSVMHWNWIDYINNNGGTVNYNEGAFFVVITTTDQSPSKSNTAAQVARPALYYWYNKLFQAGNNIAYDKKVWVWVKVHDGGHDPYGTSSFGDNHGSYTIALEPGSTITDTELKTTITPITLKKGQFASYVATRIASGRTYHTAAVLKRTTNAH